MSAADGGGGPRPSFRGPRLAGVVLLAAGVAILVAVTAIPGRGGYSASGPRLVPLIVALGLIVLSLVFLARTFVRPDLQLAERSTLEDARTHWPTPLALMAGLVAYAELLEPLGYIVATSVFFALGARVLGSRRPLRDVAVGVALAVVVYVAFTELLGVALPGGLTPVT